MILLINIGRGGGLGASGLTTNLDSSKDCLITGNAALIET